MLNNIIAYIMQLRAFILTSAIGILMTGMVLLWQCRRFSWQGRRRKFIGFFYKQKQLDTIGLSCCILKVFLLFSVIVTLGRVEMIHVGIFILLELCYLMRKRSIKNVLTDVVTGIISTVVLLVMSMLYHYLQEIVYDKRILCLVMMLAVLLCIYSICDVFHYCCYIMADRKGLGEKDETGETITQ